MDGDDPVALSAADVRALRRAEQVTCHHVDGESALVVSLTAAVTGDQPPVFTASQQRLFPHTERFDPGARSRRITCAAALSGYDQHERWPSPADRAHAQCFATVHTRRDTWRTVVESVRTGDRLTLVWLAGNNNQYLDEAGLFLDEVSLAVTRGQRRQEFRLEHTVTPDNTARMIRRLR